MSPAASVPLDRLLTLPGGADNWRRTKQALCAWQATGRAHLEILSRPVDLVSVARATTAADLPRPAGCPPGTPFVVVVYDPKLAAGLIRLAADLARRDGPPPEPPPPIG